MDVSEYICALWGDYKTHFIFIILGCIIMKVLDYITYFCLLNFLITLFGLALQEGWRDMGDKYITTVLYLSMYSRKRQAC